MSAGLYVHVPFCLTRCGYCDFNAYAGLDHLAPAYVEALRREADLHAPAWTGESIATIFLGGGTPTLLASEALAGFLDHVRAGYDVEADAEITVEANPDTVDAATFAALRGAGVTRVSLGVQSFDPAVLASLERVHGPDAARRAVRAARGVGVDDLSLDLIYGAHGETDASWRATLEETVALAPDHISAYALTIEPATPLGRSIAAGLAPAPDPDVQADRYRIACEVLRSAGFEHYEVSNWAQPGRESRHNLGYWRRAPYLGLGAGAHAFRGDRRWWNVRPPHEYLDRVGRGELPVGGEERLGEEEVHIEELSLGLRVRDGIPAGLVDPEAARPFVEAGLLALHGDRITATEDGWFVLNALVLELEPRLALST
ncbi:MAG: radical SAM family heme chaperone HemW [Actinomycetota bacterium]